MADSVHPLINENNRGPAITVAAAFCLSISLLALCARLWVRSPWATLFSYDDGVTVAGTLVATVQAISTLAAVGNGLGQRLDNGSAQSRHVLRMTYAGSILYTISLCLGKLAMALLILRLGASKQHQRITGSLAAVIVAWGVGSTFAIALPESAVEHHHALSRWIAIETFGLGFEVVLFAYMANLVRNLRASQDTKAAVLVGFAIRIVLFVIVPIRLYYISTSRQTSSSYTLAATIPEILTQLEMQCNIIAATIPCLRIFLKHFSSGYLGGLGLDVPDMYHSRSDTRNATKGSSRNKSVAGTVHGQQITVRRSVELEILDFGMTPSPWGDAEEKRAGVTNDNRSDASVAPLYPSTTQTKVALE